MLNGKTKLIDENLSGWVISGASSEDITIKLTIEDLISVSQGDSENIMIIRVCA